MPVFNKPVTTVAQEQDTASPLGEHQCGSCGITAPDIIDNICADCCHHLGLNAPTHNTHKPTGIWQCTKLCKDSNMVAIHRTTDGQHSIELDTECTSQSYPISEELFNLILKELV